jgi:hypothetical protein
MKDTFSTDDFQVFIVGPRDYYEFTWYVINEGVYFDLNQAFTTLSIQIEFGSIVQFLGIGAEAIVFSVREGTNF